MAHFLYRLTPARPDFPADMTPGEQEAMERHAAFWSGQVAAGVAIAFGPVLAPEGAFGIAIIGATDAETAAAIVAADPVLSAGLGFSHRIDPMPALGHR